MNTCTDCNELIRYCRCNAKYASENTFLRPGAAMSENALPPDEREALAAEAQEALRLAVLAAWAHNDRDGPYRRASQAIDRLARLAVQGGDAGQTDSVGASPSGTACSVASLPEPKVSALRVPPAGAGHDAASTVDGYPGSWPEDAAHENGNYMCRCADCRRVFIGHKRRVVCKLCSDASSARERGHDL